MSTRVAAVLLAVVPIGCGDTETKRTGEPIDALGVTLTDSGGSLSAVASVTPARCRPKVERLGACTFIHCRVESECDAPAAALTIADSATSVTLSSADPGATNLDALDWSGPLSVSSESPAFQRDVIVPRADVNLTGPSDGDTVSGAAPLSISWDSTALDGDVFVRVAEGGAMNFCPAVWCRFEPDSGGADVPAEAIAKLGGVSSVRFWATVTRHDTFTIDDTEVSIDASRAGDAATQRTVSLGP